MADHNDRNQGSDDLYDEAAPRSIFAATWFRAVLVLIVLGVIGAVAVPYILDAMNAPPTKMTAVKPSPPVPLPATPPSTPAPGVVAQATPTPAAPTPAAPSPATPAPSSPTTSPTAPPTPEKPTERREPMLAVTPPASEPSKSEAKESMKAPAAKRTASVAPPSKTAPKTAKMAKATTSGQWFVQVGAFKDPATAKKIATKLRDDNYKVEESIRGAPATATVAKATTSSPLAPNGGDQYDVIISGQTPDELNKRLAARGLAAEATPNGAVVKPSLPLRDAVALSKELAVDGSKVQVRRAGAGSAAPRGSSTTTTSAGSADTLHRVSVGGFPDRATAVAALKELEGKGYKPFLTRR